MLQQSVNMQPIERILENQSGKIQLNLKNGSKIQMGNSHSRRAKWSVAINI